MGSIVVKNITVPQETVEQLYFEFMDIILYTLDKRVPRSALPREAAIKIQKILFGKNDEVNSKLKDLFYSHIKGKLKVCFNSLANASEVLSGNSSVSVSVPGMILRDKWHEISNIFVEAVGLDESLSDNKK